MIWFTILVAIFAAKLIILGEATIKHRKAYLAEKNREIK